MDAVLVPGLALAFALTLLFFLHRQPNASPHLPLPPGPPPGWFGNTIPQPFSWRFFEEWTKEYGDVFTVWIGRRPMVVVGTYRASQELLESQSALTADRPWSIMAGDTMSGGKRILLVKYGERWRRLRKMLHQGLQPKMAASFEPIQEAAARVLVTDIIENPADFQNYAKKYAASVIMNITYNKTTPTLYTDPDVVAVNAYSHRLGSAVRPGVYAVDAFPILRFLPGRWKRDGKRWHAEELALFSKQLDGVRDKMARGENVEGFGKYMIEHQQEYGLSNDEAAYLGGSMFGAGSDTTASAISIAIMALALNPRVAQRAQAELDRVVGRERPPTFTDQSDLPYLQALIKEVLRWRPVSSGGFAHATTDDITYCGYLIPRGSAIVGNHWSISRDPAVFSEPDEFRPERWFEGEEVGKALRKDINHVGYGFGRRICAGKNVADRSLFINCALLIWSFDFSKKRDENGKETEIDTLAFTSSANSHPLPYQVQITPREGVQTIMEDLAGM